MKDLPMQETAGAVLKVDDKTGKPYWSLWGEGWKDDLDMDLDEPAELYPDWFPPGTRIIVLEPDMDTPVSRSFYQHLWVRP